MKRYGCILLFSLCVVSLCFSERMISDQGFLLDIPESWKLSDSDGKTSYVFEDLTGSGMLQVFVYPTTRYKDSISMISDVQSKLKATGTIKSFLLSGRDASYAEYTYKLGSDAYKGIFISIKGFPSIGSTKAESDYLILGTLPSSFYSQEKIMIESALDSFLISQTELTKPGPISQYARSVKQSPLEKKSIVFESKKIEFDVRQSDLSVSEEIVKREDLVLQKCASQMPEIAIKAWKRFYRIIWKDSYSFLDELSFIIIHESEILFNTINKNTSSRAITDTYLAEKILSWVQQFTYVRSTDGTDFINPVTAAFTNQGDCDSRALLWAIILQHYRIDSTLMVSAVYSHAMGIVNIQGVGARFPFENKKYLVAETTTKIALGQIAKDMSDIESWIGIELSW